MVAFCLGFATTETHATQFVPMSIEEIARASKLVVRGTVVEKTTLRDESGQIYTRVQLDVAEVWKGSVTNNRFTIALIGGVLGGERVTAIEQADYQIGEEVIAFLGLNARGEGVTVGLAHGKFLVYAEPGTGRKLARSRFHGARETTKPAIGTSRVQTQATLTVEAMKQRVHDAPR